MTVSDVTAGQDPFRCRRAGVDWTDVGLGALNAGSVAAAAVGLLAVTKLTTVYGRGREVKRSEAPAA